MSRFTYIEYEGDDGLAALAVMLDRKKLPLFRQGPKPETHDVQAKNKIGFAPNADDDDDDDDLEGGDPDEENTDQRRPQPG